MTEQDKPVENQVDLDTQTEQKPKKKGLWWKILLIVLAGLVVLTAAAGVIIWNVNDFAVALSLHGEGEITVEYGTEFADPGAEAVFSGTILKTQPEALPVTVSGAVDTAVVGDYLITYGASRELDLWVTKLTYEQTLTRTVHVVDTQAPVITLTVTEGNYTLPGSTYVEEGFTAQDGYDGDITHLVQRTEQADKIIYQVTDAAGNVATVERVIVYSDPVPPELTLKGSSDISIAVGNPYNEPGYSAVDNLDGDITSKVTVSGKVDTAVPGTYKIVYSVSDAYGNTVTVERTVRVYNPQPDPGISMPDMPQGSGAEPVVPNGKVIYLTFDDGPSAHTPRLLDILDKYGVKATFFVVNTGYIHLLPRIAASGHTVAMHSMTHDYKKVYASDEAYFQDLHAIQGVINSYIGVSPTILRFPGGCSNTVSRKYCPGIMTRTTQKLDEMGYRYFDWNVDSKDASTGKSTQAVINNVIGGCKNRTYSIVLQHDIFGFSVDAVETIIQWGLANGYTFLPLDASSPVCVQNINN